MGELCSSIVDEKSKWMLQTLPKTAARQPPSPQPQSTPVQDRFPKCKVEVCIIKYFAHSVKYFKK